LFAAWTMKLAALSLANQTSVFGTTKTSRLGYLRRDLREHLQSHRWSFLTISTFLIITLHHSRNFEHPGVYMPGVSKRSGTNRWTEVAIRLIPDRNSTSRPLGHRSRSSTGGILKLSISTDSILAAFDALTAVQQRTLMEQLRLRMDVQKVSGTFSRI